MHMKKLHDNVHPQFMDGLPAPRYIMSIIVASYQHCDEQQFQTLPYKYTTKNTSVS